MVSAEGLGLFGDAKSNAVGFAILNMISKGGFTLAMLKMGADHRMRWPDTSGAQRQTSWIVDRLQSYESDGQLKPGQAGQSPNPDATIARQHWILIRPHNNQSKPPKMDGPVCGLRLLLKCKRRGRGRE